MCCVKHRSPCAPTRPPVPLSFSRWQGNHAHSLTCSCSSHGVSSSPRLSLQRSLSHRESALAVCRVGSPHPMALCPLLLRSDMSLHAASGKSRSRSLGGILAAPRSGWGKGDGAGSKPCSPAGLYRVASSSCWRKQQVQRETTALPKDPPPRVPLPPKGYLGHEPHTRHWTQEPLHFLCTGPS